VEVLDRDAGPFQLTGEPALAVGREKRHVPSPGGLQGRRQLGHNSFGASGRVRLDQVRDSEPGMHASRGDSFLASVRRGRRRDGSDRHLLQADRQGDQHVHTSE